jgi:exosortase
VKLERLWQVALVAGLLGWLYGWVLFDLGRDWWNQPNLSQGFLIPPLAAYVAWLRKESVLSTPVRPDNRGFLLLAGASACYLLGKIGAEFFLPRISFVILLAGLVLTFWGSARLRLLTFPFLLLATMVPLPALVYNTLAAPLQLFASDIATTVAQAVGISVFRDGNVIHLAGVSLGVEEACSGLGSLAALMVAGLLLGFLQCTRVRSRVLLFLLTFPLAIGVNVLRVAGTAIIADYHQEFAMGFYHSFSGWLVFVAGFGILYGIATIFHRWLD